jgi:hypothetical protein
VNRYIILTVALLTAAGKSFESAWLTASGRGRCSPDAEGGQRAPFWLLGEGGEVARWAAAGSSTRAMAKKVLGRLELEWTKRRMGVCRGRLGAWKRRREGGLVRHDTKEGERWGSGRWQDPGAATPGRAAQGQRSGVSVEGPGMGKWPVGWPGE